MQRSGQLSSAQPREDLVDGDCSRWGAGCYFASLGEVVGCRAVAHHCLTHGRMKRLSRFEVTGDKTETRETKETRANLKGQQG